MLITMLKFIMFILLIFLSVAIFSLMERKILGYIHYRKGPNKVMIKGIMQPFADAMKLVTKDDAPVNWSNKNIFYISPFCLMMCCILIWTVFPQFWMYFNMSYTFLFLFIILGMSTLSVVISGWCSNSKYSILGSMRMISQSISYEVILSFIFLTLMFITYSFSINSHYNISMQGKMMMIPVMMITLITFLVELNRSPFDLAEGESEIVAGYTIEYGGIMYTLIFLSENMNIILFSFMMSFLFFSNNFMMNFFLSVFMSMIICIIRGICPRMRYDKLMMMCWFMMLPLIMMLILIMVNMSMLL